jgi:hypothetical protein
VFSATCGGGALSIARGIATHELVFVFKPVCREVLVPRLCNTVSTEEVGQTVVSHANLCFCYKRDVPATGQHAAVFCLKHEPCTGACCP